MLSNKNYFCRNFRRHTDPSGYWPRWLRLGWRKNVPMFTSSDYSAAAPSQLGIDDYESPSNNADDGSGWLYIMYGNLYIYIFEYRAYLYQFEKFGTGYEDLIFYSEQRFIMPGYLKY